MKLKEIEAQANALAPIIKALVDKALEAQADELRKEFAVELEGVKKSFEEIEVKQGEPGKDGESVSVDDVRPIVDELVKAAVSEIPAPKDGKDGADGEAGKSVSVDDVLPFIDQKIEERVAKIELPEKGKDGDDGRDAAAINILPEIDFNKSYPRGTYASHNGGMWCSHSKTVNERGWDCIVNGIADIDIKLDSDRQVSVVHTDSRGVKTEKTFSIPSMVYRGVWRDGDSYEKGDTVTWAGSLWHCDENTKEKPGTVKDSKSWTLAAKKGRDAK